MRALKVFLLFCDQRQIDLTKRLREGQLLELGELDALAQLCRLPMSNIEAPCGVDASPSQLTVTSIEAYRARANSTGLVEVAGESAGVRLRYIRQYVGWITDRHILAMDARQSSRTALLAAKEIVVAGLTARIPTSKGRNRAHDREALDETAQKRLWQITDAKSLENPWKSRHAKARNDLIVRWFMGLGIRRGELLGLKVTDLNFRTNEVFIARRADDRSDPRVHQPNTKTADRLLPLSEDLARRTREYILQERRQHPAARKHAFLFVANGGAPLSIRGLNKIFNVLRERHNDLPEVFPHLFRHTYNYNFSMLADEQAANQLFSNVMGLT